MKNRVASRNRLVGTRRALAEMALRDREFRPFLEASRKIYGDSQDDFMVQELAICLENTRRWVRKMVETSQTANIGSFPKHAYELITASLPTMTAHEAVNVQALTSRIGQIYVMEYKYGSDKGNIRSGDTMFGALEAGQGGEQYFSSPTIYREQGPQGDGGTSVYTFNTEKGPIVAGTFSVSALVSAVSVEIVDNGAGGLLRAGVAAGTIDYTTGAVTSANFGGNVDNLTYLLKTYNVNFESNPEHIGEVNVSVTDIAVTAKPRKIRAKNTLDAAWDLQQIWGEDADSNLIAVLGADIAAETDAEIYDDLLDGAYAKVETWDRDTPMGVSWPEHLRSFKAVLNRARNLIWQNTKKVRGNVVIAGLEVINVIEELPDFKPVGKEENMAGPHVVGTVGGMKVIANPFYSPKYYVVLYRGDLWIDVAYVYGPWMPLITTQTVVLDDFIQRRGLATWYGTQLVNPRMIVWGEITGEAIPTPA